LAPPTSAAAQGGESTKVPEHSNISSETMQSTALGEAGGTPLDSIDFTNILIGASAIIVILGGTKLILRRGKK